MRGSRSRSRASLACLLGALALTVGACGGAEEEAETPAADGGDTQATHSFTVAVVDPDLGAIPLLGAIDKLKEDGHQVESVEVAEPELAIEGIVRDRFQFSGETTSTALVAAQEGAPLKLVGDLVANAWAVWSQDDISSCEELDGKRFGVFSQGSVATVMVKNWVNQTCPGTEPRYLVLGESSTRYAALRAGEIDATALELSDSLQIEQQASGELRKLVDFEEELPELRPSTLYGNAEYIEQNPEATQAFVDAVAEVDAEIAESPEYLKELITKHLEDFEDEETLDAVAQEYSSRGMYRVDALTPETLSYTIDFFEQAGTLESGMQGEDVADLRFVESAAGS